MDLFLSKFQREFRRSLKQGVSLSTRQHLLGQEIEWVSPFLEALGNRVYDSRHFSFNDISPPNSMPQSLKTIFKLQAERSGAFISSQFKILSQTDFSTLLNNKAYDYAVKANPIRNTSFSVAFIQKLDNFWGKKNNCTYTVPVLIMSDQVLQKIKEYAPEKLLSSLEKIFTYSNHDYLHHMTPEAVVDTVAKTKSPDQTNVRSWNLNYFRAVDDHPLSYESSLIMNHALSFRSACDDNPDFEKNYIDQIDLFFSELQRIIEELMESPSSSSRKQEYCSQLANYLGITCLFSMIRLHDIDSPIITKYVSKLRSIDPDQDRVRINSWKEMVKTRDPEEYEAFNKLVFSSSQDSLPFYNMPDEQRNISARKDEISSIAPEIPELIKDLFAERDLGHINRRVYVERDMVIAMYKDVQDYLQGAQPG